MVIYDSLGPKRHVLYVIICYNMSLHDLMHKHNFKDVRIERTLTHRKTLIKREKRESRLKQFSNEIIIK